MSATPEHGSDVTRTATSVPVASAGAYPSVGLLVAARYRLTRVIGAGGMGTVFEAESTSVGRRCAIKFLRTELAGRSRSAERFEREARLLARLEHEHIAAVFDYGWFDEQTPFFVMEYLEGQTIRERLARDGALPVDLCLELIEQACRAMAHAHARGIVHRDLKPDNLMLTEHSDGRPWLKLLDFGIARSLAEIDAQLTPTGAALGTAHYMSPEQARGARDIDARADVYALGAILYEMLTGQRVHGGGSYNEVLYQVLTKPHVPLERALPNCPSHVAGLVERCLHKDAVLRFGDGGDLLEALSAIRLEGPAAGAAAEVQATRADPSSIRGSAGTRWARVLGAGALAALAFLCGALWGPRRLAQDDGVALSAAPPPLPLPASEEPSAAPAAAVPPATAPAVVAPRAAAPANFEQRTPAPPKPPPRAVPARSLTPAAPARPSPPRRAEPDDPSPALPFVTTNPYRDP